MARSDAVHVYRHLVDLELVGTDLGRFQKLSRELPSSLRDPGRVANRCGEHPGHILQQRMPLGVSLLGPRDASYS